MNNIENTNEERKFICLSKPQDRNKVLPINKTDAKTDVSSDDTMYLILNYEFESNGNIRQNIDRIVENKSINEIYPFKTNNSEKVNALNYKVADDGEIYPAKINEVDIEKSVNINYNNNIRQDDALNYKVADDGEIYPDIVVVDDDGEIYPAKINEVDFSKYKVDIEKPVNINYNNNIGQYEYHEIVSALKNLLITLFFFSLSIFVDADTFYNLFFDFLLRFNEITVDNVDANFVSFIKDFSSLMNFSLTSSCCLIGFSFFFSAMQKILKTYLLK